MNKKRFAAALTAALMCFSLLCACSSSDSSGSGPETSEAGSSQSDDADAPQIRDGGSEPKEKTAFSDLEEGVLTTSFDRQSGFYDGEFDLILSASDPSAVIYYTTDGSEPTPDSIKYEGAVHIYDRTSDENVLAAEHETTADDDYIPDFRVTKGTVIRAAAFNENNQRGDIACGTYFVDIDREANYLDVPVISIAIDKASLFDYETGIYVLGKAHYDWLEEDSKNKRLDGWQQEANYTQRGREWEREAHIEYICADGSTAFSQDMGVRIMGAASRNDTQKSLRLTARKEYGAKNVEYELIPNNERSDGNGNVQKYKSFVLRNGGNDNCFARIREPLLQSLVVDRDMETLQATPCVAFINGEYWGMYSITEDYSDNYFQNNYEIEKENVVLIKRGEIEEGEDDDLKLYTDAMTFINENDMSDAENYKKACEIMDMQSFADYCAFNLYINNEDSMFKDNNWRMWRVRTPDSSVPEADGRWRMAVYDVDFSSGIYSNGDGYKTPNVSAAINGKGAKDGTPAKAFASLCKNEDFLATFMRSLFDIRNINFEKTRVSDAIDDLAYYYKALMPDSYKRFGPAWVPADSQTSQKISELKSYLKGRYDFYVYTISSNLGIGDKHNISLSVTNADKGEVKADNSGIPLWDGFTGIYPEICEVTLTAKAKDGAKFKGWKAEGITLDDPTAESVTVKMTSDVTLTAEFE